MTEQELRALIAAGETLTVEFKSDQGPLSDGELIEAMPTWPRMAASPDAKPAR